VFYGKFDPTDRKFIAKAIARFASTFTSVSAGDNFALLR
jgi:hypothetical protein